MDEEEISMERKDTKSQLKEEDQGDPNALLGSHRALYGGHDDLLASQFELHSSVSKKHQMVLLEVLVFYTPIIH